MAQMGARPGNVRFHCEYLFDGIDLEDKTMLDVGAGDGRYSFYAACLGARRVVSLEPEAAGSRVGMQERFRWAASTLGAQDVELVPQRLQDYEPRGEDFDVVLLHGSINHLDEQACIGLHRDPTAQQTYRALFEKLAALSRPGGVLIVSDCSRENLFARLGIKNPIARNIEWHKHQKPELWGRMLAGAGFAHPRIRWASFNTFRSAGRLLLGNRAAAYCLTSTFCLTMERSSSGRSTREMTETLAAAP
jgi:SAM-dependent methyltransferase